MTQREQAAIQAERISDLVGSLNMQLDAAARDGYAVASISCHRMRRTKTTRSSGCGSVSQTRTWRKL
jgi:hypothetical protein